MPEDRIFVLEDALEKAFDLADFLYGCLEISGYEHAYPQMSLDSLNRLRPLVRKRTLCFHSMTVERCDGCAERNEIFRKRKEIRDKYDTPEAVPG